MKIIITYLCNYIDRNDYFISALPVGVVSMAAYLENLGFDVTLANFSKIGLRRAVKEIEKIKPAVIGVSLFTHNRADTIKFIREIKKVLPEVVIVAGGPHATSLAPLMIIKVPEIDYIIKGEGEKAFAGLLKDIENKKTPHEKILEGRRIEDLDSLPSPGKYGGKSIGVDANEQFKIIISSRGCPYKCSFCCSPTFWGRQVSFRSPENIADEIEYLYKTYGIIFFSIRDDNFTLRRDRVIEFCRILRKRKIYIMWNCQSRVDTVDEEMLKEMKLSGLEQIQYGVESGSRKILESYNKGITIEQIKNAAMLARRAGLYLSIYLMSGMTDEKITDTRKTVSLIRNILPGDGIVSPVAFYPGTVLYEEHKSKGQIDDSIWFKKNDSGMYLRYDADVREWVRMLLTELGKIRERSWYREKDFKQHHHLIGQGAWVTDILEGDYYKDEERPVRAEQCYRRVIAAFPDNPWGYLRMGKLKFGHGDFESALENYQMVVRLIPDYYGGFLKSAECELAMNNREGAKRNIEEAYSHNRFDFRILNLKKLLK